MSWIATMASVCHQLQAGFEQQLLGKRVADLDGGPLGSSESSLNSADAMVAPWMPSRPVLAPT